MSARVLLRAAGVLASAEDWFRDGAVLFAGDRVEAVGAAEALAARLGPADEVRDLGEVVLTPGLVNSHAHLELGGLVGRCPAGGSMVEWVGAVLREKASLDRADLERAVRTGAERLLETGTTCVGDIDSSGVSAEVLGETGLRGRVYREVLDGRDAARTPAARERLRGAVASGPRGLVLPGVSPHAPHTVSDELLRSAIGQAVAERSALSVHLSESPEEVSWLRRGSGPFSAFLSGSPRCSGVDLLERGGVARAPHLLVHANHLELEELERIASWGGVLVHCPGTHAFFGRAPVDLAGWLAAGAVVALGTDSLASNEDLDLRRELQLLARAHPELSAEARFRMATEGGAAALGMAGEVGVLRPGARADLVAFALSCGSREEALEAITETMPEVRGVWVGGEACCTP
jgi:cytosine/adenosine deaminase-related metal-dependent hydrolase